MNKIKIYFQKYERGSIVGLVLVIGVCLAIVGWGMLNMGFGSRLNSAKNTSTVIAREAADAGLTEAFHLLNQKLLVWPWDFSSLPSATGVALNPSSSQPTYSYEVVPNDANNPDLFNGFTIHSTGYYRDQVRKVHTVTAMRTYWEDVINVRFSADIGSKNEFGIIPPGSDVVFSVRVESILPNKIFLHPNSEIPGEIIVGPGGDPDIVIKDKKSSVVTGPTYAASEYLEYPFKPVPDGLIPSALPPSNSEGIVPIPAGNWEYPPISIGNGGKVYIEGDVTISTNSVDIKNGGEIRILEGGSLALYIDGNFIADNGSYIYNDALDATKLRLYGSPDCTQIIIRNSGDFWGAIYAPNAGLEIKNSGATIGSFVGSDFIGKNSSQFFYDARLSDLVEEPSYFVVARWWEEVN